MLFVRQVWPPPVGHVGNPQAAPLETSADRSTIIGHTLLGRGGVVVSYRTLHRYATTKFGFNQRKTAVRVADCARSAIGRVVHVDSSDDTAWRVCCRSIRVAASTLWAARQRLSGRAHRCHRQTSSGTARMPSKCRIIAAGGGSVGCPGWRIVVQLLRF
jgi:hypothetical protein